MTYDREAMKQELLRDEGLRLKVYRCTAGKLTIGVGRNLDDVGILPHERERLAITQSGVIKNGITREIALALLDSDIARFERALDEKLAWWRTLDPVRQRVILNMAFNLGIKGLLGFRNTLRFIQAGDWTAASKGMLNSLWARQVGDRAKRLAKMMREGRA